MTHSPNEVPDLDAQAFAYLGEVFPDAQTIVAVEPDTRPLLRLYLCGLAFADVVDADGSGLTVSFIHQPTQYTEALTAIHEFEELGIIAAGSHDAAIDSLVEGDTQFRQEWGHFLPSA